MQTESLKYISDAMESAGIAYEFGEFKSDISSLQQYWVGEYQENEPMTEDGLEESTFILTGTSRGSWYLLEQSKNTIKNLFPSIEGHVATLDNGSVVAIFYANSLQVSTDDAELKRIQINLRIKEWKVN